MDDSLDTLVRDFTAVGFMAKSEARRRLNALIDKAVAEENRAWLEGNRCQSCGRDNDSVLSDICIKCLEEE
jgi:hypothetical protein